MSHTDLEIPGGEMDELLAAMAERTLSPVEWARLDALLLDDPEAQKQYLRYAQLHATLQWRSGLAVANPKSVQMSPAPPRHEPAMLFRRPLRLAAAAVIVLSFVGLIATALTLTKRAPVSHEPIATLINSEAAQWDASDVPTTVGSELTSGFLRLITGSATVQFRSGAEVAITGPAEFGLNSPMRGMLRRGKLVAHVPKEARGFTIGAPGCAVLDLGTAFRLDVDQAGATRLVVLEGKVQFKLDGGGASPTLLSAGEARNLDIAGRVTDPIAERHRRWLEYSHLLRSDPSLIAYYDFQKDAANPARLANSAPRTLGRCNGQLGSGADAATAASDAPSWAAGRWPGKDALAFDAAANTHVKIPHDEMLNPESELTISLWVRNAAQNGISHLLNKSAAGRSTYNLVWINWNEPLTDHSVFFDAGGGVAGSTNSVLPTEPRWCQIVVTRDSGGTMHFYVDGEPAGDKPSGPLHPTNGDLYLGKPGWSDADQFTGLIDELALFQRALSAKEIRESYQAGRPQEP